MDCRCTNGHPHIHSPNDVAKAMTGRDYLSYSQITTYQACTLKWHFAYVEQAPKERISAALLLGSGVHAAIEHHLHALMAAEPAPTIGELMEVFRQSWHDGAGEIPVQFPNGESASSQAETAERMLQAYVNSEHSRVQGELIGIEEQLRVTLHPDLPDLLAVVDKIELRDGKLIVTDHKTAKSMWGHGAAEEHAEQLILYGTACQQMAQVLDGEVQLEFCVLTKAKSPKVEALSVPTAHTKTERLQRIVLKVFGAMKTGIVYPSPSILQCPNCPFRNRCDVWQ